MLRINQSFVQLFKKIEEKNVFIEYFDKNNLSPINVIKDRADGLEFEEWAGVAFCSAPYSAILLMTGKLYLSIEEEGGMPLIKTYVLPRLPKGFLYRYVAVHDGILLASWEEEDFYERGRAGFITIPLSMLDNKGNVTK